MVTSTQVAANDKLWMVADMMDEWTRDENTSYEIKVQEQSNRIAIYERMSDMMSDTIHELQERNNDLEERCAENNRIISELYRRITQLEHRPRTRRRLTYSDAEVIDLTSSRSESESDSDTTMESFDLLNA